jgi:DNA helicase-2/ATP-dependent DNA helicase PcrA
VIDFDEFASFQPTRLAAVAEPGGPPPPYLGALNDRQREAVLATEGPLIVLAGAGSGKTKMLTSRIAYLIDAHRVPAHQILAVTFTNKAAGEMRERVERHLSQGSAFGAPEIGTFHAVCVRLLRREAAFTPFTKPFVIYDDADQLSLVKSAVQKLGIDEKAFSPKGIQASINRAKCDALGPVEMTPAAHDIFGRQVKRVYEQYQKDLFAANALDFGEILCMTYRILRDHPEVRARYQHRWRYLHVDEYQDTNRAQYLLLSTLAGSESGGHQNICVVGDEDQSIYKWRGADIRNILDFERDYPGARVVKLEQNYRSTKTIIDCAGAVIRNNTSRKDKTLWTDNEQGLPVKRVQVPDERAEAELVVSELKRLAENEGRAYKDFAVFYRTHAQSRQFEDVLRREKIPYQIVGDLRFYDRKEIKDVLSYFKAVLNPSDSVSLKRIVNTPARGIGKATIDRLEELQLTLERAGEQDATFWGALTRAAEDPSITSAGTARKLERFVALMRRLMAEQPRLLVSELYHLLLDETAYVAELRKEGTDEAMSRVENLEEFDTIVQEFEERVLEGVPEEERAARRAGLLAQFLEESSLASVADEDAASGSSVVCMMSLHSSKGLEFPVVFMVGMEDGLFPSVRPWEETPEEEIEEERRLCYVGMTRAKEQLYLLNAAVRRIWGQVSYQEPSRFFAEMPDRLVEFRDLAQGAGRGSSRQFGYGSAFGSAQGSEASPTGEDRYSMAALKREPARGPRLVDEFSQLPQIGGDVVGQRLNHPEYGPGLIVSSEGSGHDQKVVVEFNGRDRRKFLLRYLKDHLDVD